MVDTPHSRTRRIRVVGGLVVATLAAIVPPLSAAADTSEDYSVRSGDTLSGIASRYQTSWQKIAGWNHLTNPNLLRIGQRLVVPNVSKPTMITRAPVVLKRVQIGTSVKGRAIWAYQIGDPRAARTGLIVGQVHGDERGGAAVVGRLLSGHRIAGVNLWVIPTANPDGYAANTRYNGRHVDLNRNFGTHWVRLNGPTSRYYQGPAAFSEPESRALSAFIKKINPTYVAVIHSPLNAIDADGVKDWTFQKALVRHTGLPSKALTCSYSGGCVGTIALWVDANLKGSALSVELPARPSSAQLSRVATGIVTSMGGR